MMIHQRSIVILLMLLYAAIRPLPAGAQSPYLLSATTDLPLAAGAVVTGGIALKLRRGLDPLSLSEVDRLVREEVPAPDRAALDWYSPALDRDSDFGMALCLLSPALLGLSERGRSDVLVLGVLYAESLALAYSSAYLLKGLTRRIRPYAYQDQVPMEVRREEEARSSFPSGHATACFTAASFLTTVYADYHPASTWREEVGYVSFGAATAVAWMRVRSGQHFPSDVVAGALIGSAAGWLVPRLHRSDRGTGPLLSYTPGRITLLLPLGGRPGR